MKMSENTTTEKRKVKVKNKKRPFYGEIIVTRTNNEYFVVADERDYVVCSDGKHIFNVDREEIEYVLK
jgi:hypothetical protein